MTERKRVDGKAAGGGVWIFCELESGVPHGVVPELIGKGRELADKSAASLSVVVFGHGLEAVGDGLARYPIDAVILADDPALDPYRPEPYAAVLVDLIAARRPDVVLAGATAVGREFMPRAAARIETGLTADCVDLDISPEGLLVQTCPSFGGNVMANIVCSVRRPQMVTVRHKVMRPAAADRMRGAAIECFDPAPESLRARTRRLEWLPETDGSGPHLADADIVVAGGRGMGGPEGFRLLERLARRLGGVVAATRPAVDEGWAPPTRQVGQTGRTVRPKLYFAFGISGAVHHLVGMSSSGRIAAVNKDPSAPIFSVADWGVAADAFEVIPAMLKELGE
ncbi:MAG: electron transfer flavoprotein subunit alpha/FixB family protein [Planctomycetota bacterium]|jgi:electron transfer flavoprotein alpha subunit|nr:electron transfer flavoprotein subunit alpha/FixB family protein [Planctomycetota bacterium]